jgi:uncharacterized protein (DUF302 family)
MEVRISMYVECEKEVSKKELLTKLKKALKQAGMSIDSHAVEKIERDDKGNFISSLTDF